MDNLTHSLVGALIGQAGLKRKTGLAMPALIVGANLPDVDAACFLWLDGVEHLAFRRGITHGPIAWVLLPLLLAGALWWFDRWQTRRGTRPEKRLPVHFGWLYGLAFLACLTHPALDWLNVYGIRLLEPFSSRWFYGDVLFIIDVWLWAVLGIGLWFSLWREQRGGEWRRPARIAMAVGLAYISVNWWKSAALEGSYDASGDVQTFSNHGVGVDSIASPVPFYFWRREVLATALTGQFIVPPEKARAILNSGLGRHIIPQSYRVGRVDCVSLLSSQRNEVAPFEDFATNDEIRAFLFWARAPFVEVNRDSVFLRDARFYDRRARDRFSIRLPDDFCRIPDPYQLPQRRSSSGPSERAEFAQ